MTTPNEIQVGDYVMDLHVEGYYENIGRVLEISNYVPDYFDREFRLVKIAWTAPRMTCWSYMRYIRLIPDEDVPMVALQALGC